LLEDGNIVAAIEDAKLSRSDVQGLPEAAIEFCLARNGTGWHELDAIAFATRPLQSWARRSWAVGRMACFSPKTTAYYEANELGLLAADLSSLRLLGHQVRNSSCELLHLDHHLCHAACAFYCSPFDRALILTTDGNGDGRAGLIAIGEGTRIRVLKTIPAPHSLAWVYSQITELLNFLSHKEEHKTQWLSLEGEPVFKRVFRNMFRNPRGLVPQLDYSFVEYGPTGRFVLSSKLFRETGLPENRTDISDDQRRALASSVQQSCTEIVLDILHYYRKQHGINQICLAGGLFQNVLLVSEIEKQLGLNQVFVPPAPGNAGCALGAALLLWHHIHGQPRRDTGPGNYWGPAYSQHEIKDILDNYKSRYSIPNTSERKNDATLQLLHAGKVVGWFQGPAEFGPRALGNRSLLASPWAAYVKENLNEYIKHREWFRPFAISVPEEDCPRYFEFSQLCRSMNSLGWVRANADSIPGNFCLPGGRIRLHVVQRSSNLNFWNLLKRFGERAPAPMLLNTSFNLAGEPLVTRPRDALRSYFCSGIDALVIGNFVLSKARLPQKSLIASTA